MSYSKDATKLKSPDIKYLPRLTDRIEYLFISRGRIEQTRTGVEVWLEVDGAPVHASIPIGNLALLGLGNGVSITVPALTSLHRAGTTVITTSADGIISYSCARPLTSSSRWATAQARLHCDPALRLQAALHMYKARLPDAFTDTDVHGLDQLRGMEGRHVRDTYSRLAREFGIQNFRREAQGAKDPVNIGLNIGNAILYGLAATVCSALSLNPSLGIIHEGNARAFLFDLADIYKTRTSIQAAFECGNNADPSATRKLLRALIHDQRILESMMTYTQELLTKGLTPGLSMEGDRLFDPAGDVAAHSNWGLA